MTAAPRSWGRLPRVSHHAVHALHDRAAPILHTAHTLLPHGNGRSYGDVCLNAGQDLLLTRGLDRWIAFDRQAGTLRCESGVLLGEILDLIVPCGWFLPVTPGTALATVGGAVANDVHGKNHHVAGSFGHHVNALELLRADGRRISCSPRENPDFFAATIGGLGLTGLIAWVEFTLIPIANAAMLTQAIKFDSLDAFWSINAACEPAWPYTVAWVDCRAGSQVRGVYFAGRHAPPMADPPHRRKRARAMPIDPPISFVNTLSLRAFNTLYYHKPWPRGVTVSHYTPYFHPLDSLLEWNRIYGRRGFFQYQCVLPPATMREGTGALLARTASGGQGSFLTVLKTFGTMKARGLLTFPRPGATLTLDFAHRGDATLRLLAALDEIVIAAGGALYPAKDARMPAALFRAGFPRWQEFSAFVDPGFSSSFWRRVTA